MCQKTTRRQIKKSKGDLISSDLAQHNVPRKQSQKRTWQRRSFRDERRRKFTPLLFYGIRGLVRSLLKKTWPKSESAQSRSPAAQEMGIRSAIREKIETGGKIALHDIAAIVIEVAVKMIDIDPDTDLEIDLIDITSHEDDREVGDVL